MSKSTKVAKTVLTKDYCVFSGFPIYPGRGRRFVPFQCNSTRPVLPIFSRKCQSFLNRQTRPRQVAWTVYYRREHKKGLADQKTKKRVAKIRRVVRAYIGKSIEVITETKGRQLSAEDEKRIQSEQQRKKARAEEKKRVHAARASTFQQTAVRHSGKGR